MQFLYYDANYIARYSHLPDIKRFTQYVKVYGPLAALIDRTGVLKFPVRTKSLFPLPTLRPFAKTYEDICNERASELLKRAERRDTSLCAFWSGGVDSTCLLVSLLKNATPAQKERIVVLMSEQSIAEYPAFYREHIRGRLRRESALQLEHILGVNNLIVTGEHNDQLFGSDVIAKVITRFGFDVIGEPYDRRLLTVFLTENMDGDEDTARLYVHLFERLVESAPIALKTNFDVLWWINFALKWQAVYIRVLSYVSGRTINPYTAAHVANYYDTFYNTEDFQLWSMSNLDQRMRDGWRSYKWPAKELIYGFTKDADYRDNKVKRGSLHYLIRQNTPFNFIDDKFKLYRDVDLSDFYNEANDFR